MTRFASSYVEEEVQTISAENTQERGYDYRISYPEPGAFKYLLFVMLGRVGFYCIYYQDYRIADQWQAMEQRICTAACEQTGHN